MNDIIYDKKLKLSIFENVFLYCYMWYIFFLLVVSIKYQFINVFVQIKHLNSIKITVGKFFFFLNVEKSQILNL